MTAHPAATCTKTKLNPQSSKSLLNINPASCGGQTRATVNTAGGASGFFKFPRRNIDQVLFKYADQYNRNMVMAGSLNTANYIIRCGFVVVWLLHCCVVTVLLHWQNSHDTKNSSCRAERRL